MVATVAGATCGFASATVFVSVVACGFVSVVVCVSVFVVCVLIGFVVIFICLIVKAFWCSFESCDTIVKSFSYVSVYIVMRTLKSLDAIFSFTFAMIFFSYDVIIGFFCGCVSLFTSVS